MRPTHTSTRESSAVAPQPLSTLFKLRRRYTRSVNLERDLSVLDSIDGYVPTPRALEALERIAIAQTQSRSMRAWTLTGVYGTGKSSFAHFTAALYGSAADPLRQRALTILRSEPSAGKLVRQVRRLVPEVGFVRAIATGRREPIAATVLRALTRGVDEFWSKRPGRKPVAIERVRELSLLLEERERDLQKTEIHYVAELVRDVARAAQSGVLLVIDELGKALEFAAQTGGAGDLYLLQELAELSADASGPPVLVLGLLHQAYSEYGHSLTAAERSEWEKIQGRFEDIPFGESGQQMLRLIAQVIEPVDANPLSTIVEQWATRWAKYLRREQHSYVADMLPASCIAAIYPLHPVAALVLPTLCAKYAQNDRSLFTFLTSSEPHSLSRFLAEIRAPNASSARMADLPLLKLPRVYDYFVEAAGAGMIARPQFQRWAEVHTIIRDASQLSSEQLAALKVIGALNLVSSSGPLRASRALTVAALVDRPHDPAELERWNAVLGQLQSRGLVTYRRQVDEYRVWEGTDFDAEQAIRAHSAAEHRTLPEVLTAAAPLPPMVAQRHSYRTGTLRYFERHYVGSLESLKTLNCASQESDGVVAYWTAEHKVEAPPATTADGRPLVVIPATGLGLLSAAAFEYAALVSLNRTSPALQTDGVARREVRQRLALARRVLDETLSTSFDIGDGRQFWAGAQLVIGASVGAVLSDLCDRAYQKGLLLWNELINRRELTSQGARARRELIEALLANHAKPRLGLTGDGPEVSMYASVLRSTGIHRQQIAEDPLLVPEDAANPQWIVGPPTNEGVRDVWDAIEAFCLGAISQPRSVGQLYELLAAPPYGVKRGVIPVLLAAALVYHADDVSIYRDGTFLPTLGGEHFELLVKQPDRFSVKHFSLAGIRLELFHELENVLRGPAARHAPELRNKTLLSVVRPLVRFATSLPALTRKTKRLSPEAQAVREVLLSSTEPDVLLFEALPVACGFEPFGASDRAGTPDSNAWAELGLAQRAEEFRHTLFRALRELQGYQEEVLDHCRTHIHSAFGVRSNVLHLREDLRVRAQYLVGRVLDPRLRSFVLAAANPDANDREWIESMAMIVVDRPSEAWTDEDVLGFEVHLSDFARRFANVEALQKEAARDGREGFDARRITVTSPDGNEAHRVVWIGRDERGFVEEKVREIRRLVLALPNEHQRHAVAMALVEDLLTDDCAAADIGMSAPTARAAAGAKVDGATKRSIHRRA